MKKILLLFVLSVLLLPITAFSATPTDLEVQETTAAVLSVFGVVFLNSMFGNIPDGVESDIDINSGDSVISFTQFDPVAFFMLMAEEEVVSAGNDEMPEFYYDTMSGTVSVDEEGYMTCDMRLNGGNIKTLEFLTADEGFDYFRVNGKPRSIIADMIP